MFRQNISRGERILRVAAGCLMLVLAPFAAAGMLRIGLLLFFWVPLLTGAIGWDPIYALLRSGSARK
ncbi:MAG: DUF2892 domain-containing protein [Thermoanaerobaculia bacterium]